VRTTPPTDGQFNGSSFEVIEASRTRCHNEVMLHPSAASMPNLHPDSKAYQGVVSEGARSRDAWSLLEALRKSTLFWAFVTSQ
jgi:hypothetical protein